jgi:LEA14-like dessication related protein
MNFELRILNYELRKLNLFSVFCFCFLFLTSCFSYKEVELTGINNLKVNKVGDKEVEIQAGIKINNPNNYKIKVKKIEVDLLVNDVNVGKLNLSKKVVLPRKSDQVQDFTVNTQLSNLIAAMPSLLMGGDITLKMQGYMKGKAFFISKKFPIEVQQKVSSRDLKLF